MKLKVGYQGVPGAYSEGAAIQFFGENVELFPCESFDVLLRKVNEGIIDRAALPIENSLAGTIHGNYDLILKYDQLHIVGELDFRVRHCLMVKGDMEMKDVKRVLSHPMALAQCREYLKAKGISPVEAFDTAGSAEIISKNEYKDAGAIASSRAAKFYNLKILEEGIEDQQENYTRFFIISKKNKDHDAPFESTASTNKMVYKSSIAFTLNNTAGALFKALSVFAVLDIDLTKIESRHVHTLMLHIGKLRWEYVFYIDFIGNANDERVQNALKNLQHVTPYYRLLGSYPAFQHQEGL